MSRMQSEPAPGAARVARTARAIPCLVAVLLATAALIALPGIAAADTGPVAVARLITGAATMSPDDRTPPSIIRTGTRVPSGWTVYALEGTLLDLVLPDSQVTRLGPAPTAVKWQQGRLRTVTLTVHGGQTAHRIPRMAENASYRVVTPTVVSGVRGTRFTVEVGENGASRTVVETGLVEIGEGSAERELEGGDEHRGYLIEPEVEPDTGWLRAQIVARGRTAEALAAEAGNRMALTNDMTTQDYAEMAILTEEAMRFVLNPPRSPEQIEHAANVLARGIRLYQRMATRSELMEARVTLARILNARFRVSAEVAEGEYTRFQESRGTQGQALETFVSRLELLLRAVQTARGAASAVGAAAGAASGAATGGGIRIPIPGGWRW